MIVGPRNSGFSISKVATVLSFSWATNAEVYQEYINSGETSTTRVTRTITPH